MAYTPSTTLQAVEALYIGYFGRAGEPGGVAYWVNQINAAPNLQTGFARAAAAFSVQAEAKAQHPFLANPTLVSPADFVESLYQQLFSRASDAAGKAYWVAQLQAANGNPFAYGLIVAQFISGAQNSADGQDLTVIQNKVAAAEYFTGKLATAGIQGTDAQGQVTPQVDQAATDALSGVTKETSSVDASKAKTDAFVSGGGAADTITLSINADGPNAVAPAVNTLGTSGNDTFNGVISVNGNGADTGTLNSFDNIDGSGGTDTLNVRIVTAGGNVTPVIKNVENIVVGNTTAAGTSTLNLASATGVTNVTVKDSTAGGQTNVTSIASGTKLGLDNADGTTVFNVLGAAARTGNADAINLTVANGSGSTTTAASLNLFNDAVNAADNTFEVANITTSGAASVVNIANGGTNLNTLKVSGTGTAAATGSNKGYSLALTEAGGFANVKTVDASGLTGTGGINVSLTLAQDVTFTGSAVNDRVSVTGAITNITANDKMTFGAGTDTLALTGTAFNAVPAAQLAAINSFTDLERLEFTSNNVSALKANDFTVVNAFEFSGGTAAPTALAITGVESADTFLFSNGHTNTITFTGAAVAQTAKIQLDGGDTLSGGVAPAAANPGAAATGAAVAFGGNITSLSIDSSGTTANSIVGQTGGAGLAANNAGGAGFVAIDNTTAVQTVSITGSQNLTISGGAGGAGNTAANGAAALGFSGAVNVDASTFTGKLSIGLSTGNDIIRLGSASTGDATLAGNIVTGGAGGDQITAGAGVDKFDYRVASDSVTSVNNANTLDVITGFTAGQDDLIISTTLPVSVRAVSITGTANSLDSDIASALGGANQFGGANNAAVVTITGGANAGTYAIVDTSGNNAYDAGTDLAIKMVGLTGTLSAADFANNFA